MTIEEKAAAFDKMQATLTAEGCSNIGELISERNEAAANLKKAEEARDKFSEDYMKARKALSTKGTEIGERDQRIAELEAEVESLKTSDPVEAPQRQAAAQAPVETLEQQLDSVEKSLTDEEWDVVDQMWKEAVAKAETDADAQTLVDDLKDRGKARLELLKAIKADKTVKPLPASLRPVKPEASQPESVDSVYDKLRKVVTIGPQNGSMRVRPAVDAPKKPIHRAFSMA